MNSPLPVECYEPRAIKYTDEIPIANASCLSDEYMYILTKKNTLIRFPIPQVPSPNNRSIFQNTSADKNGPVSFTASIKEKTTKINLANPGSAITCFPFNNDYIIIYIVDKKIYYTREKQFNNHQQLDLPHEVAFVDICSADEKGIFIYALTEKQIYPINFNNGHLSFFGSPQNPLVHTISNGANVINGLQRIFCRNQKEILLVGKNKVYGISSFGEKNIVTELLQETPQTIGVATGYELFNPEAFSSRTPLQKSSQFYAITKKTHKLIFFGNGIFSRFATFEEDCYDLSVNYPFLYIAHSTFISIYCIPLDSTSPPQTITCSDFDKKGLKVVSLIPTPSHSLFVEHKGSNQTLYGIFFKSIIPLIDNLFQTKKQFIQALTLCYAFSNETDIDGKIQVVFQNYGKDLLEKQNYDQAFLMFKYGRTDPKIVVRHFQTLIPEELFQEKSSFKWSVDNPLFKANKQQDKRALNALYTFATGAFSRADDVFEKNLLASILLKCTALIKPEELEQFIQENSQFLLPFRVSNSKFLTTNNLSSAFLSFCFYTNNNTHAIDYLKESKQLEELIKYVQKCNEFILKSKEIFMFIYEESPYLAGRLFCSPTLPENQSIIDEILKFLSSFGDLPQEERLLYKIQFLAFCYYKRKFTKIRLAKGSITKYLLSFYLDFFSPIEQSRDPAQSYIDIQSETNLLKVQRTDFLKLLKKCEKTEIITVVDRIPTVLLEEKLIALQRSNQIDKCIDLLTQFTIPLKVALDFCDSAYSEQQQLSFVPININNNHSININDISEPINDNSDISNNSDNINNQENNDFPLSNSGSNLTNINLEMNSVYNSSTDIINSNNINNDSSSSLLNMNVNINSSINKFLKVDSYSSINSEQIAKQESENDQNVYTKFCLKLIDMGESKSKDLIALLNSRGKFIDLNKIIPLISGQTPLTELKSFLEQITVDLLNEKRKDSIQIALFEDVLRQRRQQLKYLQNGYVKISDDVRCANCGKPISSLSDAASFLVLPNNEIIHEICADVLPFIPSETSFIIDDPDPYV